MEKDRAINQIDIALFPFLNSATGKETQDSLADLIAGQIQPTIEKTLRAKLRVSLKPSDFSQTNQDALELLNEVKLSLVSELGKLKSNCKTIQNLNSYVISVTINVYRQYLRKKYPLRGQLRNKLRYLLTHHPKFALWEIERGWFCGFKQRGETAQPPDAETIQAGIAETVNHNNLRESTRTIDLLITVFEYAKSPILFNDLLSIVAETQGIKDRKETSESFSLQEKFVASEDKTLTKIEQQENLKKVWAEICEMPIRHQLALLLNLKDRQGEAVVWLFPLLRIASVRQIAETLEFSPPEFASIWNELPWDDLKIAEYMNLTRQQVINLRQSARARLVRQLNFF